MKNIKYFIFLLGLCLGIHWMAQGESIHASAHEITHIHIQVFIQKDGSAKIVETRQANLYEGTENYIVIGNLGQSKIKDFVVKEEDKTFEYIDDWKLDASREEKAYKNSILKTKEGYELVWGIGEYGKHKYVLEYTVTNFIKELKDSQILFWRFINDKMNIPPQHVSVEIEADRKLSQETEKIWGFGFSGNVDFQQGKIIAKNDVPLTSDDYVTILVKFPQDSFTTEDFVEQSFDEIKEKAFKGSDYGREESSSFEWPFNPLWIYPIILVMAIFDKIKGLFKKETKDHTKKFKRKYRGEYYREFPYDGDLVDTYYLLYNIGATNFQRLLTSYILKWFNEGKIDVKVDRLGRILKRNFLTIIFIKTKADQDNLEGKLYQLMLRACDQNYILNQESFAKWASYHQSTLKRWEDMVYKESEKRLIKEGYISLQTTGRFLFKRKAYDLTDQGEALKENFYKYINYLHDYSLLNEHEAVNVKIWDKMMIWAAFLGLTKVVRKQFKKLYVNYEEESIYSASMLESTDSFTRESSRASESSSKSDRSSGSGGVTSQGGGSGSYGGGSGGGTR